VKLFKKNWKHSYTETQISIKAMKHPDTVVSKPGVHQHRGRGAFNMLSGLESMNLFKKNWKHSKNMKLGIGNEKDTDTVVSKPGVCTPKQPREVL